MASLKYSRSHSFHKFIMLICFESCLSSFYNYFTPGCLWVAPTKQRHHGFHHASLAEGLVEVLKISSFQFLSCRWPRLRKLRWTKATWQKSWVQPSLGTAAWKRSQRRSWRRWEPGNKFAICNTCGHKGVKLNLLRWEFRRRRWISWWGLTATTGTPFWGKMKEKNCTGTVAGMLMDNVVL